MAYQVLARKWRPQRFAEVLGQEHVTRSLTNAISGGRIAHAILLTGPRGVGKTSIARIFAKALCCEKGPREEPCNACKPCREITAGSAIDVQEIDGASNRGVDNVRELREGVKYAPASARFKVYIIDEVHMLTMEAFNALLKTLEEPPAHVKFVFATTDVHKLPSTILSRVQRYDFARISTPTIVGKLREIVDAEKLEADEAALAAIARQSEGCMRDALTMLDQLVAYTGGAVGEAEVREALGLLDRALIIGLVEAMVGADPAQCVKVLRQLDVQGADAKRTIHEFLGILRDLVVLKTIQNPAHLIDAPKTEIAQLQRMIEGVAPETLHALFDIILQGEREVDFASLPFVVLEMCVLKAAHLRPLIPVSDLVERLARLESGEVPPKPTARKAPLPPTPEGDARLSASSPAQQENTPGRKKSRDHDRDDRSDGTRTASFPDAEEPPPIGEGDLRIEGAESEADDVAVAPGEVETPWARYLAHVGSRAPLLASVLSHAHFAGISENELQVTFDVGVHADLFLDKEKEAVRLASECFDRPIRVVIVSTTEESADPVAGTLKIKKEEKERESDRERALKKEALEHDAVNQATRILGGEIKEIKTFGT